MTAVAPRLSWPLAPLGPPLDRGEIHVWTWSLVAGPEEVRAFREVMDDAERARADRFVFDRDRVRFTVAHARLRQILASYLGSTTERIAFQAGSHGKPELTNEEELRFNLSHSQELALLAVSRGLELGADVEAIRPLSDDAIADRFFSRPEVDALRSLPEEARLPGFYSCWTRKEAFLKGTGMGLSGGLDSFAVSLVGQGPATLASLRGDETAGWNLEHLEPAVDYIGAIAVKADGWETRFFAMD